MGVKQLFSSVPILTFDNELFFQAYESNIKTKTIPEAEICCRIGFYEELQNDSGKYNK